MLKAKRLAEKACDQKIPYDLEGGCASGIKFAVERADQTGGPLLARQLAAEDCKEYARHEGDFHHCLFGVRHFFDKMGRLGRRKD
jgi:hypothetical protein